jgi:hypothetical protein
MKIWKEHNDGEKYYMGNKETIEIDCTDKGTAKSIQESINGVYECMDWKCNWCGELHTDDRDYTDYKDRVDEYLGDAITEIRTAVKDKKSKKETLDKIDEWFGSYTSGEECSDVLWDIDRKVIGDFDWSINVVHINSDGDYKCDKCGKENRDYTEHMKGKEGLTTKKKEA